MFFIRGLKTVSQALTICATVNIKSEKTRPKIPLKFLYGFFHKSSGHLDSRFKKLSAFSLLLSGSVLKTFSAIV